MNTNTKIILLVPDEVAAKDAANILGSNLITDTDIRNMPKFHGYVRAMVNKSPKPWRFWKCCPRYLWPRLAD